MSTSETPSNECCSDDKIFPVVTLDSNDNDNCDPSNHECIPVSDKSCIRLVHAESPAPLPADTPDTKPLDLICKLSAEFVGTGLLVMIVVASGISAESLTDDVGLQLLINAVATMAGLYSLITIFGPVSGAHFNPIVSLVDVLYKDMTLMNLLLYVTSQTAGGIVGCLLANIQYSIPVVISGKERFGYNL